MIIFTNLNTLGRLGNQLFQIAVTCSHAKRCGEEAMFNKWEYSKHFINRINDSLGEEVAYVNGVEHDFVFHHKADYKPLPIGKNQRLYGYFQSEKYFEPGMVEHLFKPIPSFMSEVRQAGGSLIHRTNPVAIHVRRGDYVQKQAHHPVLEMDYYVSAMKLMEEKAGRCTFLVFSDDPEWCNMHFNNENIEIVNKNSGIVDLFLMAQCKHHIIANSSFSWWGAYLRRIFDDISGQIVIAPKTWAGPEWKKAEPGSHFQDFYAKNWIVI